MSDGILDMQSSSWVYAIENHKDYVRMTWRCLDEYLIWCISINLLCWAAAEIFEAKRVVGSIFICIGSSRAGYTGQTDRPVCYLKWNIFWMGFKEFPCNFKRIAVAPPWKLWGVVAYPKNRNLRQGQWRNYVQCCIMPVSIVKSPQCEIQVVNN